MTTIRTIAGVTLAALSISTGTAVAQAANPNEQAAVLALVVRLEAKPGQEEEMAEFLRSGRAIVEQEAGTTTWYAVRLGPSTFGIFDTFADEEGRAAHLAGRIPEALAERAAELLASPPVIERAEILARKIPD